MSFDSQVRECAGRVGFQPVAVDRQDACLTKVELTDFDHLERFSVGFTPDITLTRTRSARTALSLAGQWHEVKDTIPCFDFAASRRSLS
jgi:hypothetical protein